MRRNSFTTILYLAILFLSGVAVGAFGLRLYTLNSVRAGGRPNPEEFKPEIHRRVAHAAEPDR